MVEVDKADKTVWELSENDLAGNPLRLMAGCQRLPNGNTVFCNYLGHGHIGEQPMFFEITPEKKIVALEGYGLNIAGTHPIRGSREAPGTQ